MEEGSITDEQRAALEAEFGGGCFEVTRSFKDRDGELVRRDSILEVNGVLGDGDIQVYNREGTYHRVWRRDLVRNCIDYGGPHDGRGILECFE